MQDREKVMTGRSLTEVKNGIYFTFWGEAVAEPLEIKICMPGNLSQKITCAKFQNIFRGYDFTWAEFSILVVGDCFMGLTTVQR